jgi:hypothetical protein
MASLTDFVPTEEVALGGGRTLAVAGLSAIDILYLVGRFPEVSNLLNSVSVPFDAIKKVAPVVMMEIIACACNDEDTPMSGDCDDYFGWLSRYMQDRYHGAHFRKLIAAAVRLSTDDQMTILTTAIRRTIGGDDTGPLVEKIVALSKIFLRDETSAPKASAPTSRGQFGASLVTDMGGPPGVLRLAS